MASRADETGDLDLAGDAMNDTEKLAAIVLCIIGGVALILLALKLLAA